MPIRQAVLPPGLGFPLLPSSGRWAPSVAGTRRTMAAGPCGMRTGSATLQAVACCWTLEHESAPTLPTPPASSQPHSLLRLRPLPLPTLSRRRLARSLLTRPAAALGTGFDPCQHDRIQGLAGSHQQFSHRTPPPPSGTPASTQAVLGGSGNTLRRSSCLVHQTCKI